MFDKSSFSLVLCSCLFMAIVILGQKPQPHLCNYIECANGGMCQLAPNSTTGYKCRCQFGFTGLLCEDRVNITLCVTNPCQNNGNCTITSDRQVKCTCSKLFTGANCEIKI